MSFLGDGWTRGAINFDCIAIERSWHCIGMKKDHQLEYKISRLPYVPTVFTYILV